MAKKIEGEIKPILVNVDGGFSGRHLIVDSRDIPDVEAQLKTDGYLLTKQKVSFVKSGRGITRGRFINQEV